MTKQDADQKIKDITDKIVTEYQPEKIILFGSFAWGNPTKDSDIDLLVIKKSDKSRFERAREVYTMISKKGKAVDIIVYTPEEVEKSINDYKNLFIEDIMRNGKVLYSKPQQKEFAIHFPQRPLKILH